MKKGFTLVELIAVIVLLGLISVFTFPSVNKTIKNRKEALYNIQIDNIKASALSYVNKYDLLKESDKVIITLCQLKQNGFEDEKLKNPINNELIPDDSKVIVTKNSDGTEYEFIYGTKGNTVCTKNDNTLFEYVEVGSVYKESVDTTLYDVTIYNGENVVSNIDTSKLGTYYIEYVSDTDRIDKYVYIVDTTGPNIEYTDLVNGSKVIGKGLIELDASSTNLFVPYSVIVSDNSGEEINAVISTNINLKIVGTYYITYKATDSSGNSTIKTQPIKVVDKKGPTIVSVDGNPTSKTSMSAVIYVNAYDDGVGLNPLGAYSFDGGKTWQVDNSITVDSNQTLNIVVRDTALNVTNHKEIITNIIKDDKNISFSVTKGTLKNNGWYTSDVNVLVKPLVSNEYFDSFKYCVTNDSSCEPNIESTNYDGETISITENSINTLICANVIKKDGSSTNTICSTNFKIDKSIPGVRYNLKSGTQNDGYLPWFVSNVILTASSEAISGIEKIMYCTTTSNSCIPNKEIIGNNIDISLSSQSETNKVCGIVTNRAGIESSLICSVNYAIDKTSPSVSITVDGNAYTSSDGKSYVGKNATLKADVAPSSTISGYSYVWYKNGGVISESSSDSIVLNYADGLSNIDEYSVKVITGAGNSGSSSKTINVDTIKPTCSLTANGTKGNNEWFISNSVSVIGTFKDNESGIDSKGIGKTKEYNDKTTYSVSNNTSGDTVYCYVKDKVGNENSNSISVKKDDGSGTTCTLNGQNSSWTNGSVMLFYEMYNGISGFSESQDTNLGSLSVYGDACADYGSYGRESNNYYGLDVTFYCGAYKTMSFGSWSAVLNSGATVSCPGTSANVYYDGDEPTCEYEGENSSWTNQDVTLKILCNDGNGSGCKKDSVIETISTSMSKKLFEATIEDNAGNTTNCSKEFDVKVDKSSPTCSFSGNTPNGTNGWYKSSATITATFDDTGGSGISSKGVSTSSGIYNDSTSYYLSEDTKEKTLYCSVKDEAGNVGTNSIVVKKDDGSSTSCYVSGENSAWTNNSVSVRYYVVNNISEPVLSQPSPIASGQGMSTSSSWSGSGSSIYYSVNLNGVANYKTIYFNPITVTLNSGATPACGSLSADVYYDKEKPTCSVNISSSGISGVSGYIIVSDNYSGPKTSRIDFSNLKSSQSYEISDNAGNTNTCTVNVSEHTVTSYKTCSVYSTCRTGACGTDSCAYTTNTCKSGWIGREYGYYYQPCTAQGCGTATCYSSNPNPNYFRQVGTDKCVFKSGTWSDCVTGSPETCQSGYKECASVDCGCDTWSDWSNWSIKGCTDVENQKTCRTSTYYEGG